MVSHGLVDELGCPHQREAIREDKPHDNGEAPI